VCVSLSVIKCNSNTLRNEEDQLNATVTIYWYSN